LRLGSEAIFLGGFEVDINKGFVTGVVAAVVAMLIYDKWIKGKF